MKFYFQRKKTVKSFYNIIKMVIVFNIFDNDFLKIISICLDTAKSANRHFIVSVHQRHKIYVTFFEATILQRNVPNNPYSFAPGVKQTLKMLS